MNRTILKYLAVVFFFSLINLYSQDDTTSVSGETFEDLIEESSVDAEDSQLLDLFEQLQDNPININKAEPSELLVIPFIDYKSSQLIIDYRKKRGAFFSKYELFSVKDLDTAVIRKILPFVTTARYDETDSRDLITFSPIEIKFRSRIISDLQTRNGFIEDDYAGSKIKSYNRLKLNIGENIKAGFLIEKDPGESEFNDFSSFNIMFENVSFKNRVIFGDFLFEFGKGLAAWSPYSFSKGSDAVGSISKRNRNIVPYTSADENKFFRGVAASAKLDEIILTGFYSDKMVDANIDSITGLVTSLPLDGYHRTENEMLKRKTLSQRAFGLSADYSPFYFLRLSAMYMCTEFSNQLLPSAIYDFSGSKFDVFSFAYNIFYGIVTVGGEFAYNRTSVASINNVEFKVNKNFTFVTSIRSYPRNYTSLFANGFGEGSATQNELGIYNGFRWRTDYGTFNFYYDQFKFPYATYYNPVPTSGSEYLVNYSVKPFRNSTLQLRYKNESKEVLTDVNEESVIKDRITQQIRAELIYNILKDVRLKTRVEYLSYQIDGIDADEDGFLIFQDVNFNALDNLKVYCRLIFFDTDSYNSRLYEFENDIPGTITNSPMYGKGVRWYVLAKYKLFKNLSISARYTELYKPDEETLGTGLSEIEGNVENKFSLQLDVEL
ncbi:MAG: helix-hairpin-helix domain-containing protein [bacterium]